MGSFLVPNSVFWVSRFCLISHLFFYFLDFFNFPKPLFLKRPFFRKNEKSVCQKHYKNSFFKGCQIFKRSKNNCLLIGNFENIKNEFVATNSV